MRWKNWFWPKFSLFLLFGLIFSLFLYQLTDEKLSPQALDLLVADGYVDSQLRIEFENPSSVIRLPKDSIFDHREQILIIEKQFNDFKAQVDQLKKDKSQKEELLHLLDSKIRASIESLYSINPMKLMSLNLKIIQYCLNEIQLSQLQVEPLLKSQLLNLDSQLLTLKAARFHAQSILGSIHVLQRSKFFTHPKILLIQKQRLVNLMAEISSNQNIKMNDLEVTDNGTSIRQLELLYAHFFKQLLFDPQIDLSNQVNETLAMLKI